MGEQTSDLIAMEIDSNPEQLSVAIATISALNLNDPIHQVHGYRNSNLYNPDTWESVLNRNRNAVEKPEASKTDVAAAALDKTKSNDGSFFDCNICLDLAKDPVVTCCGHLFCWPCIYRWLNLRASRTRTKECPVCKGEVTDKDVIPIYGVGNNDEVPNEDSTCETPQIPPRPNAKRVSRDSNPRPVLWDFNSTVSRDFNERPHSLFGPPPGHHIRGSNFQFATAYSVSHVQR
ncbi:E3 ubiquitin-protein ligase RMA3-like [Trifolium pratense]|nr:E3 ubiquitin-protein ligase RMA3-like [Trifolium pratense]XP_045831424.1 E3 ubiquitin-protein ligase RMA3-like [Trifolium pratense]